jgi:hypothetical protein
MLFILISRKSNALCFIVNVVVGKLYCERDFYVMKNGLFSYDVQK